MGESCLNYRMLWVYQPIMNISAFHPILEWPDSLQGSSCLLLTMRIMKSMNIESDGYGRCFRGETQVLKSKKLLGIKPFWSELFLEQSFKTDVHTLANVHWHFLWKFSVKMSPNSVIVSVVGFSLLLNSFMAFIFCNIWKIL